MVEIFYSCCLKENEKDAFLRSKTIDRVLERDKAIYKRTIKILLLGSGESGKSTFLKQMKIIHGDKFSREDLLEFRDIIYTNIIKGMRVLVDACSKLRIPFSESDSITHARILMAHNGSGLSESNFLEYADSVKRLWSDNGIQIAFERRAEFQLTDSVRYFFNSLDQIKTKGYLPSMQDVLHSRKATQGVVEYDVHIQKIPFKFVDVGGQRSQRYKWFQCFNNVTAIMFLVATNEYDLVLLENRETNRLVESIDIFETIVQNKNFLDVSIILFLNKTDLLQEKVAKVPISHYFREFRGDSTNLQNVQRFIFNLFDSKCQASARRKPLFHHFTTAVDTENIKFVFQASKDTILQDNLRSIMMQ